MPDKETITVSTGNRLKQTRIEKGFTIEDVQKKTKIHPNILRAIEEDRLSTISPIYVKGFLKIYCQFLGLKPEEFIRDYKEVKAVVETAQKPLHPKPLIKAAGSGFKMPSGKLLKSIGLIILAIIALIALIRFGRFVSVKIAQIKNNRIDKVVAKKPPLAPAKEYSSTAINVNAPSLTIRATEDCRIQVKLDGKLIFQGLLKKGRAESWTAKEKIELSLSNAAAASLSVNGKVIPSLGRKGQAVKSILITKKGMTVAR